MERLEREARERQGARTDLHNNIVEEIPQSDRQEKTRDKAAALFNTNPRYVKGTVLQVNYARVWAHYRRER